MKSTVIALAVAAALGAGSIPAFARDHDGGHDQQQWQHRGEQRFERHDRDGRWDHRGARYYAQPHYRSYYDQPQPYYAPGYYAPGYYSYDGDSYDGADVIGGAILGALAGGLVGQLAAGR